MTHFSPLNILIYGNVSHDFLVYTPLEIANRVNSNYVFNYYFS
ncbi:hypothetical protein CLOSBL3_10858 [Clostridiaceae bacterium BL-3]|nr:hypothetical protein CLOSBL3_10858 [Clostridiaceae bacterium BL-3]